MGLSPCWPVLLVSLSVSLLHVVALLLYRTRHTCVRHCGLIEARCLQENLCNRLATGGAFLLFAVCHATLSLFVAVLLALEIIRRHQGKPCWLLLPVLA